MPEKLSLRDAVGLLRPGMNVYIPGLSAESTALISALEANASRADGVTFFGAWVPGVNRYDYAGLHARASSIAFFLPRELRRSFTQKQLKFHALPYTAIYSFFETRLRCDVAFLHLSPPDASGMCSTGIAADFAPAVWRRAGVRIGLLNGCMPRTRSPAIALADLDYVVEMTSGLLEYAADPMDETTARIAANVATLIDDGDVLQIGIGTLPAAVLTQLKDRRNLRIHSGMVTQGIVDLIDAGAISPHIDAIRIGVGLGCADFYRRLGSEERVSFHPVPVTHGFDELRKLRKFVAINSALTIDLFGQLNVEAIDGRQVSGIGGITDFIRGASASNGGRAIIALPSITRTGVARIVGAHPPNTPIAATRSESLIVVTEHGIADLRGLSLDERADALIAVADPTHRAELRERWRELRRRI
jgi:acyl-CoA hydrolase